MLRFAKVVPESTTMNSNNNNVPPVDKVDTNSTWSSTASIADEQNNGNKSTTSRSSITTITVPINSVFEDCNNTTTVVPTTTDFVITPEGLEITIDNNNNNTTTTMRDYSHIIRPTSPFELAKAQASNISHLIGGCANDRRRTRTVAATSRHHDQHQQEQQVQDPVLFRPMNAFLKKHFDQFLFLCHSCKSTPFVFSDEFEYDDNNNDDHRDDDDSAQAHFEKASLRDSFASEDANANIHDELHLVTQMSPEDDEEEEEESDAIDNLTNCFRERSSGGEFSHHDATSSEHLTIKRGLAFDLEDIFVGELAEQRDDKCFEMIDDEIRETIYNILQQSTDFDETKQIYMKCCNNSNSNEIMV